MRCTGAPGTYQHVLWDGMYIRDANDYCQAYTFLAPSVKSSPVL